MQDLFSSFDPQNLFVQHTLFAFASLALGLFGMVLGQHVASYGKLCILLGVSVGVFTMWLLTTPYATLAPGIGGVFLTSFLASGVIARLVSVSVGTSGGAKKPAATPTAPPKA